MSWAPKDPSAVDSYYFVWCDKDGTNDGGLNDDGELQGETISSYVVTVPAGITKDSDSSAAVTIQGVSYGINTVVRATFSGGTAGTDYAVECSVTTSGSRTLIKTETLTVKDL